MSKWFMPWILLLVGSASAATPEVLFQKLSKSVVIVRAKDTNGNVSQGSGIAVDRQAIVTNCHVVEGARSITVSRGKEAWVGTVVLADRAHDLCQLFVAKLKAEPVAIESRLPAVGSRVYALGSPLGLEMTISDGLVAGIRTDPSAGTLIQISVPISPGSSGGGLFSADGKLIGITTFKLVGGENLNFAFPARLIRNLANAEDAQKAGPNLDQTALYPLVRNSYVLAYTDKGYSLIDPTSYKAVGPVVVFTELRISFENSGVVEDYFRYEVDTTREVYRQFGNHKYKPTDWSTAPPRTMIGTLIGSALKFAEGPDAFQEYLVVYHDYSWIQANKRGFVFK